MPLLTEASYPRDVVQQQREMLSLKGYHVIFDDPCTKRDWERQLPCRVQDGLIVCILLYQKRYSDEKSRRFRFCINNPTRRYYLEIGDYVGANHFVAASKNFRYTNGKRADLLPKTGDYFWVKFVFASGNTCKMYFKEEHLDTYEVSYEKLNYLYAQNHRYNAAAVLSFHIVSKSTTSPIINNLSSKPLGFIFVTARITVEGKSAPKAQPNTVHFRLYEYGKERGTTLGAGVGLGSNPAQTIEFRILSYATVVIWEVNNVILKSGADGSRELILIMEDFIVSNVVVHTGMYHDW